MVTSQVTQDLLNHSHRDKTTNLVLFDRILETLEVLINEDLNKNVSTVHIGNLHSQATVGSMTRKDTGGLIAQK